MSLGIVHRTGRLPPWSVFLFQTPVLVARIASIRTLLRHLLNVVTLDKDVDTSLDRRLVDLTLLRDCPVRGKAVVMLSLEPAEAVIHELLRRCEVIVIKDDPRLMHRKSLLHCQI